MKFLPAPISLSVCRSDGMNNCQEVTSFLRASFEAKLPLRNYVLQRDPCLLVRSAGFTRREAIYTNDSAGRGRALVGLAIAPLCFLHWRWRFNGAITRLAVLFGPLVKLAEIFCSALCRSEETDFWRRNFNHGLAGEI